MEIDNLEEQASTIREIHAYETISSISHTYAIPRKEPNLPLARICRWETTQWSNNYAPKYNFIVNEVVVDSTDVKCLITPTEEELLADYLPIDDRFPSSNPVTSEIFDHAKAGKEVYCKIPPDQKNGKPKNPPTLKIKDSAIDQSPPSKKKNSADQPGPSEEPPIENLKDLKGFLVRFLDRKFEEIKSDVDRKFEELKSDVDQKFEDLRGEINPKFEKVLKDLASSDREQRTKQYHELSESLFVKRQKVENATPLHHSPILQSKTSPQNSDSEQLSEPSYSTNGTALNHSPIQELNLFPQSPDSQQLLSTWIADNPAVSPMSPPRKRKKSRFKIDPFTDVKTVNVGPEILDRKKGKKGKKKAIARQKRYTRHTKPEVHVVMKVDDMDAFMNPRWYPLGRRLDSR